MKRRLVTPAGYGCCALGIFGIYINPFIGLLLFVLGFCTVIISEALR